MGLTHAWRNYSSTAGVCVYKYVGLTHAWFNYSSTAGICVYKYVGLTHAWCNSPPLLVSMFISM